MHFIIIHSINFEDLLPVNRMLYKGTKTRYVVLLYLIENLKPKNEKNSMKKLKTDVQVELCFFVV